MKYKRTGVKALAEMLNVHRQTVNYWVKNGVVPYHRDRFGRIVFTPEDIKKIKVWRKGLVPEVQSRVNRFLKPVIEIEDMAAELYSIFSYRFSGIPEIKEFFLDMSHEERLHSSIVRLIGELVWKEADIKKLKYVVPLKKLVELKKKIYEYRKNAYKVSLKDAFASAVELETLERDAWPKGLIQTLTRIVPDAFKGLPVYVFDGEGSHSRKIMEYMKSFFKEVR